MDYANKTCSNVSTRGRVAVHPELTWNQEACCSNIYIFWAALNKNEGGLKQLFNPYPANVENRVSS